MTPGPSGDRNALYVNFASAAGVLNNDIDDDFPDAVAADINPKVKEYFQDPQHARGRFGVVLTDFETTEINTLIAQTNAFATGGYWVVYQDAQVEGLGFATSFPPVGAAAANAIAIAATRDGLGYYLLSRNGTVAAYGAARHAGDGVAHGTEAVAIAVTPAPVSSATPGYWILAANGKVRAFNAVDHGEIERGTNLEAVSIVPTPDGGGYWILASNGRIHVYGNADQLGDKRDSSQEYVAMASTLNGDGYWILATNGRVFRFGNARGENPAFGTGPAARAIVATHGGGYLILRTDGSIHAFGGAPNLGYPTRSSGAPSAVGLALDPLAPLPGPAGTSAASPA